MKRFFWINCITLEQHWENPFTLKTTKNGFDSINHRLWSLPITPSLFSKLVSMMDGSERWKCIDRKTFTTFKPRGIESVHSFPICFETELDIVYTHTKWNKVCTMELPNMNAFLYFSITQTFKSTNLKGKNLPLMLVVIFVIKGREIRCTNLSTCTLIRFAGIDANQTSLV